MSTLLETQPKPKINDFWLVRWFGALAKRYKGSDEGRVFADRGRAAEERTKQNADSQKVC